LHFGKTEIFLREGLDRANQLDPPRQIGFLTQRAARSRGRAEQPVRAIRPQQSPGSERSPLRSLSCFEAIFRRPGIADITALSPGSAGSQLARTGPLAASEYLKIKSVAA
jgi:hypothetical protein